MLNKQEFTSYGAVRVLIDLLLFFEVVLNIVVVVVVTVVVATKTVYVAVATRIIDVVACVAVEKIIDVRCGGVNGDQLWNGVQ